MDNPQYEYFLLGIAEKVAELVTVPENRKRFEQRSCELGKKQAAYSQAMKRVDTQWKIALKKPLPEQTSYLKRKGWNQVKKKVRSSPMNVYSFSKNHWKFPKMPTEPLLTFLSVLAGELPEAPLPTIDKALACYYFSLATIHDKMREGDYIPIHNDTYAKQLAKSVWPTIENLCVDRRFIIKTALDNVEANLAQEPPETDPPQGKIGFLQELPPEGLTEVDQDIKSLKEPKRQNNNKESG